MLTLAAPKPSCAFFTLPSVSYHFFGSASLTWNRARNGALAFSGAAETGAAAADNPAAPAAASAIERVIMERRVAYIFFILCLLNGGGWRTARSATHRAGVLAEQQLAGIGVHGWRGVDGARQGIRAHRRRPLPDALEPCLQRREVGQILALLLMRHYPRIARHVGDAVLVAADVVAAIGQLVIEHAVQTRGLLHISFYGVRQRLRRVLREVVGLSRHRTESAHLPEQPLQRDVAAAQILRDEAAGLVGQVQQDRARFENRDRRAAVGRRVVDDGGDAVVRRDAQELRLELFALADMDRRDVIVEARLFKEQGDFVAVGRGPVVQVDHGRLAK